MILIASKNKNESSLQFSLLHQNDRNKSYINPDLFYDSKKKLTEFLYH